MPFQRAAFVLSTFQNWHSTVRSRWWGEGKARGKKQWWEEKKRERTKKENLLGVCCCTKPPALPPLFVTNKDNIKSCLARWYPAVLSAMAHTLEAKPGRVVIQSLLRFVSSGAHASVPMSFVMFSFLFPTWLLNDFANNNTLNWFRRRKVKNGVDCFGKFYSAPVTGFCPSVLAGKTMKSMLSTWLSVTMQPGHNVGRLQGPFWSGHT